MKNATTIISLVASVVISTVALIKDGKTLVSTVKGA
jgi:hypothetical protein